MARYTLNESKCEGIIADKILEIISDKENDIWLEDIIFNDEIISELKIIKEKIMNFDFKGVK